MTLKEFALKLGLDLDAQSFARGQLAANALAGGLLQVKDAVMSAFGGMYDGFIGFNARAEAMKMRLAGIIGMNLKLPFEEAKVAASDLFKGLQADAARTPAETSELVEFATNISSAFMTAKGNAEGLKDFTTGAVVAAKTLGMSGIAQLDITQALTRGASAQTPFINAMLAAAKITKEQFNAKPVKERLAILTEAFSSPTIKAAMKEYESNWDGVTSTLKDNISIIMGEVGKPLFEFLKKVLGVIGGWIQKNQGRIVKAFLMVGQALATVARVAYDLGRALWWLFSTVVKAAVDWLMSFGRAIGITTTAVGVLAAAMLLLGKSTTLAMLEFIAIAAVLGLIILIVDDLYTFLDGGESLIGEFGEKWLKMLEDWLKPVPGEWWITRVIKDALDWLIRLEERWKEFKQLFTAEGAWDATGINVRRQKNTGSDDTLTHLAEQAERDLAAGRKTFNAEGKFVKGGTGAAVKPNVTIHNKIDFTLQGTDEAAVEKVKRAIEEHHEKVMRITREALAQ